MAFSKGEERLIEATVPVIQAVSAVLEANAAYAEAGEHAAAVAQEQFGDEEVQAENFHAMLVEAGQRAGFEPDTHVMKVIEQSFAEFFLAEQLMEQVQREAAREALLDGTGVQH